ncbi:GGDEF domain-containing protein [uncultured Ferrimonas sp.]|uniref:GGDEF domain-containing protein n=1 Tax=uncultured Ferrimonas sp. TaxID=432640 RepID=UPI00262CB6E2|nr:GGDEF domain-containing protein [uncultured Ferrimonas sp.]
MLALLIAKLNQHVQYGDPVLPAGTESTLPSQQWHQISSSTATWHRHEIEPYQSFTLSALSLQPITLVKVDQQHVEVFELPASQWQSPLQYQQINSLSRPIQIYHSIDDSARVSRGFLPNPVLFMLLGALLATQLLLWLITTIQWDSVRYGAIAGPVLLLSPFLPLLATCAVLTTIAASTFNIRWIIPVLLITTGLGVFIPEPWLAWGCVAAIAPVLCYQVLRPSHRWYQQLGWLALFVLCLELPVRADMPLWLSLSCIAIWQLCQLLRPLSQLPLYQNRLKKLHEQRAHEPKPGVEQQLQSLSQQVQTLEDKNRILHEKTWVDALTGLRNRLFFNEQYQTEVARSARERSPTSLLMLDLDNFKKINDTYGHPGGDQVLQQVAKRLYYSLRRPADALCRIGGEEFAILLPQTSEQGALHVAEIVLKKVAEKPIKLADGVELYVTISIGCASLVQQSSLTENELLNRADSALYLAKRRGRNRVECAGSQPYSEQPQPEQI